MTTPEIIAALRAEPTPHFLIPGERALQLCDEIDRLKAGRFTPEEFQNLCHNFSETDRAAFFQGCHEYQRKLFGCSERDLREG